ncbi:MAG: hypothetical protein ACREGJ_01325 [Candidatus Saccharimonadales bacterium]
MRLVISGISDETYERLRRILEKQNRRIYSLEEAKEIGDGLIDFFALLSRLEKELARRP